MQRSNEAKVNNQKAVTLFPIIEAKEGVVQEPTNTDALHSMLDRKSNDIIAF